MIEVRVGLGTFEVSLEQLLNINAGEHFEFAIIPGQILDLYIGEDKIAEALLVKKSENYYLEISKMLYREES